MSIKADEASSLLFLKLGKPCRPRSSGLTPLFPVAHANHFGSPTLGNEAILLVRGQFATRGCVEEGETSKKFDCISDLVLGSPVSPIPLGGRWHEMNRSRYLLGGR